MRSDERTTVGTSLAKYSRKGGIALEAAVIMPLVIIVLALALGLLAAAAAESKLKGALDRTAAELSLLSPLCDLVLQSGGDLLQVSDLLPDDSDQSTAGEWLAESGQGFFSDDDVVRLLSDGLLDLASSALLGPLVMQRIEYWLEQGKQLQPAYTGLIRSKKLYLDFRIEHNQLWLCLSYKVRLPLLGGQRYQQAVVPLWLGRGEPGLDSKNGQIWLLDNFSRGQILRQSYGGNLPYDYPVIARWQGGEAAAIKSIDLTAPTYQDPHEVRRRLVSQIDQLAAFSGAVHRRADQETVISAAAIKSRRFLLVLPENSPAAALEAVNSAVVYAQTRGVTLEIRRHGSSTRYVQAPEDE